MSLCHFSDISWCLFKIWESICVNYYSFEKWMGVECTSGDLFRLMYMYEVFVWKSNLSHLGLDNKPLTAFSGNVIKEMNVWSFSITFYKEQEVKSTMCSCFRIQGVEEKQLKWNNVFKTSVDIGNNISICFRKKFYSCRKV